MDRKNIDKIAQTEEDRVLLAKLWDKINAGIRKNIVFTSFRSRNNLLMNKIFLCKSGLFSTFSISQKDTRDYLQAALSKMHSLGIDMMFCCHISTLLRN